MTPALSVIIACRNAESTLGDQLESLASQRGYDGAWEVLVCDNGSTDGSIALAESYRFRLPLRVVRAGGGRGPAHARNVGAAASSAPWLAFVDADDVVGDGWLAAMTSALREHPFVAGRFDGRRLNPPSILRTRALQQADGLQTSHIGPRLPHAGAGNMGVHRSVFFGVGGFDETMTCLEDTDFCWRVQLSGVPLVFVPEALLHVRLRSTWSRMWEQGRNYGAATAELERRYGHIPPPQRIAPVTGSPDEQRGFPRPNLGLLLWKLGWHAGHRTVPAHAGGGVPVPSREAV